MRTTMRFNDDWLYLPQQIGDDQPDSAFTPITLPHTNKLFPHHNFSDAEYQFISTYRKRFTLPEGLNGRRLYLDFEGAMLAATVSINGHTFEEYRGGYTPFSFDITDHIHEHSENLLTVHLDSRERPDIPPFGYVVDYLSFGGIYRNVHLRYVEPLHIDNIRVQTLDLLTDSPRVEIDVYLHNQSDQPITTVITGEIADGARFSAQATVNAQKKAVITTELSAAHLACWTLDDPQLIQLTVRLDNGDSDTCRFGLREAVFREDGFYLNGEITPLRGLNRHQLYPYIGAAAPDRLQRQDADILKFELGCHIVRTSHYPQSVAFLDRCDEIGLLVLEEIPGWQHIGDADWQALSQRDVRAMIERDWNHPSIVLWGVRINESWDNTDFYTETNRIAHELDSTRQTTGIRFFIGSEFLEDVYGFNDFSNAITEPENTPHLITEFNGHMFPTKTFDNEERQVEHALRHARIQDGALGHPRVTGAIGWCAFDYNTHKEFGSGDRICYHGVMDMFRLPKFAAYAYASQQDPAQKLVLQPATFWTMGDRSVGGNDPLYIFSNCDSVEVFAGKDRIGVFEPNRAEFPNLPHPPFKITGLAMRWGEEFGDLRVVGYLNGEAVTEHRIDGAGLPARLVLHADDDALHADGADMSRIVVQIVDKYGNRLPYTHTVITFALNGAGTLIGENPLALVGGQACLYVKATHTAGVMTLRAEATRLPPVEITITTIKIESV